MERNQRRARTFSPHGVFLFTPGLKPWALCGRAFSPECFLSISVLLRLSAPEGLSDGSRSVEVAVRPEPPEFQADMIAP
jgi:hypothetical protein